MEKFFVNMAIVKVNWDDPKQKTILDNYIPLIAYTLKCYTHEVISLEDFRDEFKKVAEFEMPTAAIATLLKKAVKKYKFVSKNTTGEYVFDRKSLPSSTYEQTRDRELRKYNGLKDSFFEFCQKELSLDIEKDEIETYFFEILYEIAPALFKSISEIDTIPLDQKHTRKYLVARFISYANQADQKSFEAIESFVRGAMLTETFYYSDPNDLQGKMRKVLVFFDTTFLLRAIGLCDNKYSVSCLELIEILRSMGVRMWCFKQTFNEMHGILRAASTQTRGRGRTLPHRPGDVFDYYNSIGASESDIELDIATLDNKLNKIGVQVKEKPEHEKALTVDESILREEIITELPNQSEQAQDHDIDCLTSIYRLRRGKVQKYLESCGAIFVTSNAGLAKASTRFFNKFHGISDAPVCMSDQVFTTLVWLKAVNKAPDLPRHRLVANCFAALQPSDKLWSSYIKEANSLRDKGTIGEDDYAVLIYSLEARDKLMELTLGEDENIRGTVQDVLADAKKNYTAELSRNLKETQLKLAAQQNKIMALLSKIARISKNVVLWFLIIIWFIPLFYIIAWTSPDEINKANLLSFNAWAFWLSVFVTLMNLVFGCYVYSLCKIIADNISRFLVNRVRGLLVCKPSQEF